MSRSLRSSCRQFSLPKRTPTKNSVCPKRTLTHIFFLSLQKTPYPYFLSPRDPVARYFPLPSIPRGLSGCARRPLRPPFPPPNPYHYFLPHHPLFPGSQKNPYQPSPPKTPKKDPSRIMAFLPSLSCLHVNDRYVTSMGTHSGGSFCFPVAETCDGQMIPLGGILFFFAMDADSRCVYAWRRRGG